MSTTGVLLDLPVVDELAGASDTLARADASTVWRLTDGDVERGLSLLVRLQAQATALQAVLMAEVESRNMKARTGAPSTERWLADRLHLSRADGGARLRQSIALRRHPGVLDALATGAATVEQGEVLAAVLHQVDALPGVEEGAAAAATEFLVEQCALLAPRELARAGQAVVETLTRTPSVDDPADEAAVQREHDRAERALQQAERNWLTVTHRPGGRARIRADLGPVGAAAFLAWCRQADKAVSGDDGFEDTRTRSERRGDALVDLFTRAGPTRTGNTQTNGTVSSDTDPSGIDEPRAREPGLFDTDDIEDLVDDVDDDAGGDTEPGMPGLPGQRGGVVLNLISTLDELRAGIPGTARLDTGAPRSVAALRQLACEAQIVPAVMAGASQVLDLGRSCRHFNRAQHRAAALRDRGCVAPGCDAPPSACHQHHSRWWIRGGPTDLDNAALLCGFHHRMIHRQDWAITLAANGFPQLHPPPVIDPSGRPRQHHRFTVDALSPSER
jgi:hypothetical protein